MADQKLSALTRVGAPALADLLYLVDVSDTTDDPAGSSRQTLLRDLLGVGPPGPNIRLSCTTGVVTGPAVQTTDQVGAGTLYLAAAFSANQASYGDGTVPLYDGTRVALFGIYNSGNPTLGLSGLTAGSVYDVFAYWTGSTVALELGPAWTNATTRSTSLLVQNGLLCRSGAPTRLYVGTIVATGTGTTEDSLQNRYCWSYFNQVPRPLRANFSGSWNYNTNAWRQANGSSGNQLNWVSGDPSSFANVSLRALVTNNVGSTSQIGIGFDSTTFPDVGVLTGGGGYAYYATVSADWIKYTGQGSHYAAWLENGSGAGGTTGVSGGNSWMTGWIMG